MATVTTQTSIARRSPRGGGILPAFIETTVTRVTNDELVNLGAGAGVASSRDGNNLQFRSLISASGKISLSAGTSTISLDVVEALVDHDQLLNFVADEHVAHSGVTLTAGVGLSGGGTIAASRTFDIDWTELTEDISPESAADYVATYDTSAGAHKKVKLSSLPSTFDISALTVDASPDEAADYLATYDTSAGAQKKILISSIDHDNLTGFVADEHVAHTGVTITAGVGLAGGGDISASRTLDLDITELTADANPDEAADYLPSYDTSAGAHKKILIGSIDHDALTNFSSNKHIDHTGVTLTAGVGLAGGGDISASRTFDLDITELTEDTNPDESADFIATYDTSALAHKKVKFSNIDVSGLSGYSNIVLKNASNTYSTGDQDFQSATAVKLKDSVTTFYDDASPTKAFQFDASPVTAGQTRVLGVPNVSTDLAGAAGSLTFSSKTLDTSCVADLVDSSFTLRDSVASPKIAAFSCSALTGTRTFAFPDITGETFLMTASAQNVDDKTIRNTNTVTLKDTLFTLQDDGDTSRQLQFQLSGITAGNTRTWTAPDASGTVALTTTYGLAEAYAKGATSDGRTITLTSSNAPVFLNGTNLTSSVMLQVQWDSSGDLTNNGASNAIFKSIRTLTAGASVTDDAAMIEMTRQSVINNVGTTFTVSGAVLFVRVLNTQTSGTLADTTKLIELNGPTASTWTGNWLYAAKGSDANPIIKIAKDGTISIGIGGATAVDTILSRTAAGILDVVDVVDANTGFRINGAAASGQVLAGNGTNFVSTAAAGIDSTAIHDDTSSEIHAVTEKTAVVAADEVLIEDSAASYAKKRVQISNLLTGVGVRTEAVKTGDETVNNSDVYQDDDALTLSCVANTLYEFEMVVWWSTSTTADIKIQPVHTGTTTAVYYITEFSNPAGTTSTREEVKTSLSGYTCNGAGGTNGYMLMKGILDVGATGGVLKVQWAQGTAELSDTKVLKGSRMYLRKIA